MNTQQPDAETRLALIKRQAKRVRRESSILVTMVARAEEAEAADTDTAEEAQSHDGHRSTS